MKRVAKIYDVNNADAKTEINALRLLTHSGVTPRVYDFFEQDERLFVMMDYVPGVNAQTILDQDGLEQGRRMYEQLGKYLAKEVHSVKRDNKDTELPVIMKSAVAVDGLEFIPTGIMSMANEVLSTPDHGEQTLIHGDYEPHQECPPGCTEGMVAKIRMDASYEL
ncbi:serine/threonine protein kinase [Paenibacillus intestini]|nr:serine/threonine protein kinase [Paenibacillus intestini]